MATSAIAVPLSRQAKAQALLAVIQDNAEMEGWLGDAVVKYGPTVLKTGLAALGSALLWDEKLDREVASVQKKAEIDEAEIEGLLRDIGGAVGKYGPTVLKFLGGAGFWGEELDRESAAVQKEAEMDKAEMEGLLSDIKKLDPTMLSDGMRLLNEGDARVQQNPSSYGLQKMKITEKDIKELEQQTLQHQGKLSDICQKLHNLRLQYLSQKKAEQERSQLIDNWGSRGEPEKLKNLKKTHLQQEQEYNKNIVPFIYKPFIPKRFLLRRP